MSADDAKESKKGMNTRGILVLVLVSLLVVPAVYWFISWQLAYVLLLTLPWIAYGLFMPRSFLRFFTYAYLIYFVAFITAVCLQILLAENPRVVNLINDVGILQFFLGGEHAFGKQMLFSVVVGTVVGILVVNVPFLALLLISSEWVLALRGTAEVDRKTTLRYLWSLVLGVNKPWLIVEAGEVKTSKPPGVLAMLGGPGMAVIRPGNAVVFERAGEITRTAGPGNVQLKRFEQVRAIVELKPMWSSEVLSNVLTKDRIPLKITFGVGYQIEPKSETDRRTGKAPDDTVKEEDSILTDGVYNVYKESVRKAVFETAGDWRATSFGVGENTLRGIIATYDFDALFQQDGAAEEDKPESFDPDERVIKRIEEQLLAKHKAIAPAWGVMTKAVDIKIIELPEIAQEQMLKAWKAEWDRQVAEIQAEAISKGIELRGKGEAAAIASIAYASAQEREMLVESLSGLVQRMAAPTMNETDLKLTERFLAAMEAFARAVDATDSATAVRYVEALEEMATESGTKVLVIGDEKRLLPEWIGSKAGD